MTIYTILTDISLQCQNSNVTLVSFLYTVMNELVKLLC